MLLPVDGRKLCLHKEKLVVDRASEERRMVNGNRKKHPEKLSRSNGWRGSRLIVGYLSLSLAPVANGRRNDPVLETEPKKKKRRWSEWHRGVFGCLNQKLLTDKIRSVFSTDNPVLFPRSTTRSRFARHG